ncbi:anthranilate phosphoribosyltransferase [bacterium]|nr:anthranilate phosphoribosyltransferase [bacterium]
MIRALIGKVVAKENLSREEARAGMEFIMNGEATPAQIAAWITGLRMKGESVEEITGCAQAMRSLATTIQVTGEPVALESDGSNRAEEIIVDTCGTGGDGAQTFNISTAVAFVAAAGGLTVAKHGNRAVSSKCGSADVLEALGVNLKLTPAQVQACIQEIRIGFLFAPLYHMAMKHAAGPRKEIGIRTIFNILGPLANPAGATVQVLGVFDPGLTSVMAAVLKELGIQQAMVVHGHGTLDEFSLTGPTTVSELKKGEVKTYQVLPSDFGMPQSDAKELRGGTVEENSAIILDIFKGKTGPKTNAVVINAAAVFVVAGKVSDLKKGAELAHDVIQSGKALEKLEALIAVSKRIGRGDS